MLKDRLEKQNFLKKKPIGKKPLEKRLRKKTFSKKCFEKETTPMEKFFFGEKAPLKKEQILFKKKNNLSEKKL